MPVDLDDPFALQGLADDVAALGVHAQRRGALVRAEVVRYLFIEGWLKLHARYADAAGGRAALLSVWRLMLESVVTGAFGVSTPTWRDNAAYPDRFFPRLWLDVLPSVARSAEELTTIASMAFNLGENLLPRSREAANGVAEALYGARERLSPESLPAIVQDALIDHGFQRGDLDERGLVLGPSLEPERAHATFVPAHVWSIEGGFMLLGADGISGLPVLATGTRLDFGALDAVEPPHPPALSVKLPFGTLAWRNDKLWCDDRPLISCRLTWPTALAADEQWVLVVDALSRKVLTFRWRR